MTSQLRLSFATVTILALLVSLPVRGDDTPATGAVEKPGVLWEVTSQMSMEGMDMAMPVQNVRVCSPKVWTEPPAPENQQQKCAYSEFKLDGPKATWKIACEPPHAMTGTGEITRDGDDAYTGVMTFSSADGSMTIKLDGRRVGDCDNPRK
jgi:hypothetical protein